MEFWDNPDFLVKTGSHLYGVARPDSDIDYRGFVFPPVEFLVGLDRFEQKEFKYPEDKIVYSYHKFVALLMQSNTHALETLFAPDNMVVATSKIAENLKEKRSLFVSKASFRPFWGFSISEWRKVKGTRIEVEKITPDEQRITDMIREVYKPDKVWMDEIVEVLMKNHTKTEVSSTRHLGEKRKLSIEKHGYSVKNAYHAIRLLHQGIELLSTGNMTFPRPEVNYLQDIRNGKLSLEDLEKEYERLMKELKLAEEKSPLPARQDRDKINKVLIEQSLLKINRN